MEITDVRVFLRDASSGSKLKAYATITLDGVFVVRNLKVIEGTKGLFVAMPSERAKEPCPACGFRCVVRSRFCSQCGKALPLAPESSQKGSGEGQPETAAEHRDIAHPITAECRETIQSKVLKAFEAAQSESSGPSEPPPPQG